MEYKLDYYNNITKIYSYGAIVARILFMLYGTIGIMKDSNNILFKNDTYCQIAVLYFYSSVINIPINLHFYYYANHYWMIGLHYSYYITLDTICLSILSYISMTSNPLYKYIVYDIFSLIACICGHVSLLLYSYQKKYDNIATSVELEDEVYYQSKTLEQPDALSYQNNAKVDELSYQNKSDSDSLDDSSNGSNNSSDSFDIIDGNIFKE